MIPQFIKIWKGILYVHEEISVRDLVFCFGTLFFYYEYNNDGGGRRY
jgi:hypothetical protein